MDESTAASADRESLFARLVEMIGYLETTLGGLPAEIAAQPGPNGSFAPVEHVWHLADLEREGFGERIRRILEEDDPDLPDFDGDRIARERHYLSLSLAEGMRAFRAARAGNIATLRAVPAAKWTRAGIQAGAGRILLEDLPAMMAAHDASHRGEIEVWRERFER